MIKYAHQYLRSAETICQLYNGSMPLAVFLKQYFQQHKKFGSKDRRHITHLCYCYYRLGHALPEYSFEERLRVALFLCDESMGEWNALFDAEWITNSSNDLDKRIDFIQARYPDFSLADIFSWTDELSEGIEWEDFATAHFIQPDLFLRIRPGNEENVLRKLTDQEIAFKQLTDNCISLTNTSKADTILDIDREAVIQDYSSQKISAFLQLAAPHLAPAISVWDCCAASGGKSILIYDIIPNIELSVSDVRPSIIQNLKKRFERAGIKKYRSFLADLANNSKPGISNQQLIICDAPCTGSGTWGRTPEQLYFFQKEKINEYALLQQRIISNVVPCLAADGYFLYITCSVFKKENEDMVKMISENFSLTLVRSELLKGYGLKADSMFAALFKNHKDETGN